MDDFALTVQHKMTFKINTLVMDHERNNFLSLFIDAGLVGSTDFQSSYPQGQEPDHHVKSPDEKHQLVL